MCRSIPSDMTPLDSNDSGLTDRLYMGGRLWRFDIKDTDPGRVLFTSNSGPGDGRKIFYPADVTQEEGYEFLFFGTGDREHPKNESVIDRIYAVKDTNPLSAFGEASLVDVTADLLEDPNTPAELRTSIRNSLASGNGWYIRLGSPGEKVLAPALTPPGTTYLTTFTPFQFRGSLPGGRGGQPGSMP